MIETKKIQNSEGLGGVRWIVCMYILKFLWLIPFASCLARGVKGHSNIYNSNKKNKTLNFQYMYYLALTSASLSSRIDTISLA